MWRVFFNSHYVVHQFKAKYIFKKLSSAGSQSTGTNMRAAVPRTEYIRPGLSVLVFIRLPACLLKHTSHGRFRRNGKDKREKRERKQQRPLPHVGSQLEYVWKESEMGAKTAGNLSLLFQSRSRTYCTGIYMGVCV